MSFLSISYSDDFPEYLTGEIGGFQINICGLGLFDYVADLERIIFFEVLNAKQMLASNRKHL